MNRIDGKWTRQKAGCPQPAARTPLMLQTVLGIDAARVASAFLVSPTAMSQRLVRAKSKIRDAAIPGGDAAQRPAD